MGTKRKRSSQNSSAAAPPSKKQAKSNAKPAKNTEKKPAPKAAPKHSASIPLDTSPFVNDPKGPDLKREVQLYDVLSSEDETERLNAATAIVSGLLEGEGVEESTLQRHLERRLFRGLASGRKAARLGFSVVITEILEQLYGEKNLVEEKYSGLTFDKVLGFLVAKTKPDGDLSGQEEKDHHFGLLFGLQCFVRAKMLFDDDDRWTVVLDKLLELAKKKPWIREECGWVIVEALSQMNEVQAKDTLDRLIEAGLAHTPEGVGIWLVVRNRFPDVKLPAKPWGKTGNPLENLQSLAKALKESSNSADVNVKSQQVKSGSWNPQLHFVWELLLSQYATGAGNKVIYDFEHFWKVAVDDNLFSATASRERKYWGFLVFQKVLQNPTSYGQLYGSVFSHNLVRCIINHAQQEDRFLNGAAKKSLNVLAQSISSNPELLPSVLPGLIGGHGIYSFDKVTKTKCIAQLLGAVNSENVESVIEILLQPARVVNQAENSKDVEVLRLTLAEYLMSIIRKVQVKDSGSSNITVDAALSAIARIAYAKEPSFQPPLSEKTRTLFRNHLSSAFHHLLSDVTAYGYPYSLLQSISPEAISMEEDIAEVKSKALSTVEKIVKRIKKADEKTKASLQALALLYSLVIFQLYNGEPEAVSVLDELSLCYDKLIRHKQTDDDVEASEVLVELLLSFLSKPSALLRKVSEHVFAAFMSEMTEGSLKLMTDVLESEESLKGQQALFDQEPEDANEMEVEDGEDDELDSDVEVVDMEGDEGHLNGHLDESDDDNEEDDDDEEIEDDDDEEGTKLDAALALALGTHKIDPNAEGESDSDADMTDSEMMALDSKLVEIFSQRKKAPNKKQEQKAAKETMLNFKSRLLDLLDIYVKRSAANPLAFGLLLPLLQLIRKTKSKSLGERSQGIISAFAKAFKSTKVAEVAVSDQIKLLKAVHLEASRNSSHSFSKAASTASLLVVSSIYRADKAALKKIANVYRDSQVAWVEGEVKMQASFFIDWVNWSQSHATTDAKTS